MKRYHHLPARCRLDKEGRISLKIGEVQASGLEIYVFDPAVQDASAGGQRFPGRMTEGHLVVRANATERAWSLITDAANSADDDVARMRHEHDPDEAKAYEKIRDGLTNLAGRVLRCK